MISYRPAENIRRKIKGFTLIEFMVASSLAIIVIMAAGGTYFMTRKLNQAAQQRLDLQQNLRNASLQITREARIAGSFGCYNTGNNDSIVKGFAAPDFSAVRNNPDIALNTSHNNGFGVHKGTFGGNPALFFVYGQGEAAITRINTLTNALKNTISSITVSANDAPLDGLNQTLAAGGYAVLSSCRHAIAFNSPRTNGHIIALSQPLRDTAFNAQDSGTLSLSKLHASAYVFNAATKQLFRVELGTDGRWQSPQLLAGGINQMDVGFGYVANCPASFSDAAGVTPETFTFSNENAERNLPALVQIRLNYDLDTKPVQGGAPQTADYIINATVRGGNTCGNRLPL